MPHTWLAGWYTIQKRGKHIYNNSLMATSHVTVKIYFNIHDQTRTILSFVRCHRVDNSNTDWCHIIIIVIEYIVANGGKNAIEHDIYMRFIHTYVVMANRNQENWKNCCHHRSVEWRMLHPIEMTSFRRMETDTHLNDVTTPAINLSGMWFRCLIVSVQMNFNWIRRTRGHGQRLDTRQATEQPSQLN